MAKTHEVPLRPKQIVPWVRNPARPSLTVLEESLVT